MNSQIILFDTEYTAWEGSKARKWSEPWEHREIIQIAAVRVMVDDKLTELGCFDCLIKPKHNPVLSSYIIELTGIQQVLVDTRGIGFPEAFDVFYDFCERGGTPLFCYGDDPVVMRENYALHGLPLASFSAGIYDIRGLFEQAGIDTRQYTSGTVHQAVAAEFDHAAHNALNDVRSLAVTIRQLMQMGKIGPGWLERTMPNARFE